MVVATTTTAASREISSDSGMMIHGEEGNRGEDIWGDGGKQMDEKMGRQEMEKKVQVGGRQVEILGEGRKKEFKGMVMVEEKQCIQRVEQLRVSYVTNLQDMRMGHSASIQAYLTKLNLYQQQILLLRNQLQAEHQHTKTKQQQLSVMSRAIQLLSLSQSSSSNSRHVDNSKNIGQSQKKYLHNESLQTCQEMESQHVGISLYAGECNRRLIEKLVQSQAKLGECRQELEGMRKQASSLRIELFSYQSKFASVMSEKDSLLTQSEYYRQQYEASIRQVQQQKLSIQQLNRKLNDNIQLQNAKEKYINQQLKTSIAKQQLKIKQLEEHQFLYIKQITILKEYHQKLQNREKQLNSEIQWYRELLDEAKGNFLYSELKKQQIIGKLKQENCLLKKQLSKTKIIQLRKKEQIISQKQQKQQQRYRYTQSSHSNSTLSYNKWSGKNKNSLNSMRVTNGGSSVCADYDDGIKLLSKQNKYNSRNKVEKEGNNHGEIIMDKYYSVSQTINQMSLQDINHGKQQQNNSNINYSSNNSNNYKRCVAGNKNFSKTEESITVEQDQYQDNKDLADYLLNYGEQCSGRIIGKQNQNNMNILQFRKHKLGKGAQGLKSKQIISIFAQKSEKGSSISKQLQLSSVAQNHNQQPQNREKQRNEVIVEKSDINIADKLLKTGRRNKQSKLSMFAKIDIGREEKGSPKIKGSYCSKDHEIGEAKKGYNAMR